MSLSVDIAYYPPDQKEDLKDLDRIPKHNYVIEDEIESMNEQLNFDILSDDAKSNHSSLPSILSWVASPLSGTFLPS